MVSSSLSAAQRAAYDRDGFVFLPGLFDADEIAPLARFLHDDPEVDGALCAVADQNGNPQEVAAYTELGSDYLSVIVRLARMVAIAEAAVGAPCYHWHSKLSMKRPGSAGQWNWHQDYAYWYFDGAVFPHMVTVAVAVDRQHPGNGCLKLVRGSHRLGRVDHVRIGEASGIDPRRLDRALAMLETVDCVMAPVDAVAFHCNTLHASGPNLSAEPRTILHCSYNAIANDPLAEAPTAHSYRPLDVVPDAALRDGAYSAVVTDQLFTEREAGGRNGYGYRVLRGPRRGNGSGEISAATSAGLLPS